VRSQADRAAGPSVPPAEGPFLDNAGKPRQGSAVAADQRRDRPPQSGGWVECAPKPSGL